MAEGQSTPVTMLQSHACLCILALRALCSALLRDVCIANSLQEESRARWLLPTGTGLDCLTQSSLPHTSHCMCITGRGNIHSLCMSTCTAASGYRGKRSCPDSEAYNTKSQDPLSPTQEPPVFCRHSGNRGRPTCPCTRKANLRCLPQVRAAPF